MPKNAYSVVGNVGFPLTVSISGRFNAAYTLLAGVFNSSFVEQVHFLSLYL